ncbi:MAG TPA: amylo-alpha-1,6-glucosidase [Candidatus Saccharimonadales bacterium]|nr:amylo-alpha-1,6-glucosidase [Candidatus Saccharimonadales bacterium]
MNQQELQQIVFNSLLEMATEEGINASGRHEVYGCIFGRDSAITIVKILKASANKKAFSSKERETLHLICKRALVTLVSLQGKELNIESGEEPGKFIHEYRKDNYERLLQQEKPWHIYPDGVMRNYDSIDSTPLMLIALYRYWRMTKDTEFLIHVISAVESGLAWLMTYADKDRDFLVEYELSKDRKAGGLPVQSWTDSHESLLNSDKKMPPYPIAPVEVQGYVWLALRLWAGFYKSKSSRYLRNKKFAKKLSRFAKNMKKRFNKTFLFKDHGFYFPAQALDGNKKQIRTITGNPLLLLWASYKKKGGKIESILDDKYIDQLVQRSFMEDMFEQDAGIRTMSRKSPTFDPSQNSYHNGSYWPKLNGMAHEGLHRWGYDHQAELLKHATIKPIAYFKSPIELYIKTDDGKYLEYRNDQGQVSCRQQAWSAATALDLLTL